jgi:hypothetical protein
MASVSEAAAVQALARLPMTMPPTRASGFVYRFVVSGFLWSDSSNQ